MFVTLVDVTVKKAFISQFIEASEQNHLASVNEPGNCRFDVLQSSDNPCQFVLYEAYCSEKQAKAHKETEHYQVWRDTVAEMMEQPRQGHVFQALAPQC